MSCVYYRGSGKSREKGEEGEKDNADGRSIKKNVELLREKEEDVCPGKRVSNEDIRGAA